MNLLAVVAAEPLQDINYRALYVNGSTLYAAHYVDGTLQSVDASLAHGGAISSIAGVGVVQHDPFVVAVSTTTNSIFVWDVGGAVLHEITGHETNFFMAGSGGEIFWTERSSATNYQLWKADTGGLATKVAHAVSDTLFTDSVPTFWAMLVSATTALEPVRQDDEFSDPSGYVRYSGDEPTYVVDADFLPFTTSVDEWANWKQGHRRGTSAQSVNGYASGGVNRLALVADGEAPVEIIEPGLITGTLSEWVPSPSGAHAGLRTSSDQIAACSLVDGVVPSLAWFDIDPIVGASIPLLMVPLDAAP